MITLTELAHKLDVSVATVSNALSGKGRMREEKRRSIIEAAVAEGYDISSVTDRQRKRNICVITEQVGCAFSDKIIRGISTAAEGSGNAVSIYNLNMLEKYGESIESIMMNDDRLKGLINQTLARIGNTVSGIIYVSQSPRNLDLSLPRLPYPMVCTYCRTTLGYPTVNYDDMQGAYLATEKLIRSGCKRIAVISGHINSIPMTNRLNGYQRALVEHQLAFDPRYMQVGAWTSAAGYDCAKKLLGMEERPDAIFCQCDAIAFGAIRAAREMGISVPDELSIAGFDAISAAQLITPKLTTVEPPFEEMGRRAYETLIDIFNKKPVEKGDVKLPCALREGGTTR